jgi:hypothetical protein
MSSEEATYTVGAVQGGHSFEDETVSGEIASQAALKLARRLPPADTEAEAAADPTEITIRNRESGDEFVFDAWTWTEDSTDGEEWMPEETTEVSVRAKALDDPHEWFLASAEADQWEN